MLSEDRHRVAALRALDVLDRPRRADLDSLTRLAAYVCGTPTAVINLIDADRQWPAAAHGCSPMPMPRAESMCATSILTPDVSYTPDASHDPRWATNPFVSGRRGEIRLYAAAPLTLPGGEIIGTICAFVDEVTELSRLQLERLRDIADQAVRMLELRRATGSATPRPADRPAQPSTVRRGATACGGQAPARRGMPGSAVLGPGRLQGGQRRLRSRGR
ncbi:MAG: GAF domain-containing protein [Jatrophihabitans sp.]